MNQKTDHAVTKKKPKASLLIVVVGFIVVLGAWLLWVGLAADGEKGTGSSTSAAVTSEQVETITGRWRRPDGGYIIDIKGLNADGSLQVPYFNPRPINVSQAGVVHSPEGLHIFIELWDEGYPGATYRLDHDNDKDILTGVYFQPSVNQSFDVIFVRAQ